MNMEELLAYLAIQIDEMELLQKQAEENDKSSGYYIGFRSACSEIVTKIKTPINNTSE